MRYFNQGGIDRVSGPNSRELGLYPTAGWGEFNFSEHVESQQLRENS